MLATDKMSVVQREGASCGFEEGRGTDGKPNANDQCLAQMAKRVARGNAQFAWLARFAQIGEKGRARRPCRALIKHRETSGSAQIGQADDGP